MKTNIVFQVALYLLLITFLALAANPDSVIIPGDLRITGPGNGLVFPDGSIQYSATVQEQVTLDAICNAISAANRTLPSFCSPPGSLPSVAGTWSGTWVDDRYNVSGSINAVLTQTATTFSGTGTIDLTALGLGIQSGTAAGTISGNTMTFTFNAANVGSGSGTLAGTGGSGTGNIEAPLNFGAFTFTGTASNSQIAGLFNFTSPTGGNGTINVTKQ